MRVLIIAPYTDFGRPMPYIQSQVNSLKGDGIHITELHYKERGIWPQISFCFKVRNFLKKHQFDIIHAHFGYIAFYSYLWSSKTKLVFSFMGEDLYGILSKKNKQTFQGDFNRKLAVFLQSKADWIIVKSDHMFSFIKPEYSNKTSVIPNGVDLDGFKIIEQQTAKKMLNLDTQKKQLLFLGKKSILRKNYDLAYNAYALLKDNNVELLAPYPVESDTVHIYMNACDVLLFPSTEEGSPNVVKEAVTCNCPVVATDVGDVAERINGIEGCYLSSYEAEDFMQNIKKALAFNARTKGREALAYLDNRIVAHSIISIYNRILDIKSA